MAQNPEEIFQLQVDNAKKFAQQAEVAQQQLRRPSQPDISPILGLIDTWTGSKLAQNYKPPTSVAAKQQMDLQLEAMKQNRFNQLAKMQQDRDLARERLQARTGIAQARSDERVDRQKAFKAERLGKKFERFTKEIALFSSRRRLGKVQTNIDAADAILVFTNGEVADLRKKFGADLSEEEALNHLTHQQVAEVNKSFDRLISNAAPTVSGQEDLKSDTLVGKFQEFKQKVSSVPQGAQLGAFVSLFLKTVRRERKINLQKKQEAIGVARLGFKELEDADPERFNEMIDLAVGSDARRFTPGGRLNEGLSGRSNLGDGGPSDKPLFTLDNVPDGGKVFDDGEEGFLTGELNGRTFKIPKPQ